MKKLLMAIIALQSAVMLNAAGKINGKDILAEVDRNIGYVNTVRTYLHRHPELSGKEFKTAEYLKSELARTGDKAVDIVKKVTENVAGAHGCTISYKPSMLVGYPPALSDSALVRKMGPLFEKLYPGHVTYDRQYVWYASETFSMYNTLCPALFTLIGINNGEKGTTAEHHNSQFEIDNEAMPYALGAMVKAAIELGR